MVNSTNIDAGRGRSWFVGGLVLGAGLVGYELAVRPWYQRWGATVEEAAAPLPGDELLPHARYVTTHAVTIAAPPDQVWPWIVQIGQGRGGFYSYDWLENLFDLGIHSADRIVPDLQKLEVGDIISLAPDNAMPLTVEVLEPNRALVIRTGSPDTGPQPAGDYLKGEIAGTWAFILEPRAADTTRFIVRWRADWKPGPAATLFQRLLLEPAHFIMERAMMLGIKQRAEQAASGSRHAA